MLLQPSNVVKRALNPESGQPPDCGWKWRVWTNATNLYPAPKVTSHRFRLNEEFSSQWQWSMSLLYINAVSTLIVESHWHGNSKYCSYQSTICFGRTVTSTFHGEDAKSPKRCFFSDMPCRSLRSMIFRLTVSTSYSASLYFLLRTAGWKGSRLSSSAGFFPCLAMAGMAPVISSCSEIKAS
jgi:hypothetical protein